MSAAPSTIPDVSGRDITPYIGKRYTETGEYLIFVRRVLRGLSHRVGSADLEALREMVALRNDLEASITEAVAGLRNDPVAPASWGEIGQALDITRQAAQQRYGAVGGRRRPGGQPADWR